MTYYIKDSNRYTVSAEGALDIRNSLPAGTYIVKYDDKRSIHYLVESEPFGKLPNKVYGSTTKDAERILRTYFDRPTSTGVLLLGEKGSGKTMLAKMLAANAYDAGIPTLIINTPFCGDTFNKFIQDIDQECVVLFDEFEKIYDEEDQEQLLTLLDGVFPQKKLFILTCNDEYKLDRNLKNRPGRIFYSLQYYGLEEDFVREYLADNLKDKSHVDQFVLAVNSLFDSFNFDMMQALVEEMNRYNETVREALKFVDARPTAGDKSYYNVSITLPAAIKFAEKEYNRTKRVYINPLSTADNDTNVHFHIDGEEDNRVILLNIGNLVEVDAKNRHFVYDFNGIRIELNGEVPGKFDYMGAFNEV